MKTTKPAETSAPTGTTSRRDFIAHAGRAAAATALAGVALPHVHAAGDDTIRLAIIGCGGRGTGAVANALEAPGGPTKLIAMADLFESRLSRSHQTLRDKYGERVEVPADRRFLGFDAYRHAIDSLRPGDVVLCTTHSAFRGIHVEYAVSKGINVFMEKTFAPDPGGLKRILRAGEAAAQKGLKIGAGVMCRHSSARQALIREIRDGAMGDIQLIRAYRMDSGYRMGPLAPNPTELLAQIRLPYQFLWASSGIFIELMIHQIDECCWIKDGWPVMAHGVGGRGPDSTDCSQNFDTYSIEYTFADGTKALVTGRYIPKCHNDFATFVHGTKCAAQFSGDIHAPTVQRYKDQRIERANIAWRPAPETVGPWQAEWNVLLDAIRNDKPHNEARRACYSNLAAIMGRAAVHTGQVITWEEALASDFKFCADVDALDMNSPAPVTADANGRYPAPTPGAWQEI
ncbi:MAG: Gfo/Idh/MocA family oxidoreductase [Verrucomicrobiales bacterium]|nr:Gfo/Idh/MocA family oxidoreductase [Verrucomicrobiales bacterium]MCP5526045.1 Gfo/Idh/MocA family oxidoreductase [Verrucomicrobiales bacterium]